MLFILSFYIFSTFISYLDCTKYKIPNITLSTLSLFLIIFGYLENQLNIYSFIISFTILIFFVIILLISPSIILGGGDIKYMMVIAIYIEPLLFPLFILFTGISQMIFLFYFQKIKKRRVAPMAPAMFLSAIGVEIVNKFNLYPF